MNRNLQVKDESEEPYEIKKGLYAYLAQPTLPDEDIIKESVAVERNDELDWCSAAWGWPKNGGSKNAKGVALNFRLQGPPGVGKNEIVYSLARESGLPLYSMLGHEELTPEDLSLTVVPDHKITEKINESKKTEYSNELPLVLRASPLASAMVKGGIFFFDEISRVPERVLSPLASVLDDRRKLYSALTGTWIECNKKTKFYFCCAMNDADTKALPEYIQQRLLPAIFVKHQTIEDLIKIVKARVNPKQDIIKSFKKLCVPGKRIEMSARQAITIAVYAERIRDICKGKKKAHFATAKEYVLGMQEDKKQ